MASSRPAAWWSLRAIRPRTSQRCCAPAAAMRSSCSTAMAANMRAPSSRCVARGFPRQSAPLDRSIENRSSPSRSCNACRGAIAWVLSLQKATELGVARIVPVLSKRSVVRLDETQASSKQTHWQAVAVSACEQCGRNRLPRIEPPRPLLSYLGELGAAADPAQILRLILEPDQPQQPANGARAAGAEIAIGPEGGFAPEEIEAFALCSFIPVGLGPRILRTETAAIAALVVLQTRYGDMSGKSDSSSRSADA